MQRVAPLARVHLMLSIPKNVHPSPNATNMIKLSSHPTDMMKLSIFEKYANKKRTQKRLKIPSDGVDPML
ncbi:hypothetical protein EJB05_56272 [Eragrostis curvula]|uniref:Uncharacterized protein n=1 Tax=Eragrostis curvula TaxID=38414 RepID=A0A5J9SGN5_9POAL|nr:hypothetical protein EJB05_56272 [Eragrostis curvula]